MGRHRPRGSPSSTAGFATIIGRWPDLVAALFGRAIARSRSLLLNLAIGQLVGVDIRLLVLLWHIAERWGDHEARAPATGASSRCT